MEKRSEDSLIVVGISGVSNGGKTTLANSLADALKTDCANVHVIHQDDYFKKEEAVPYHGSGEFRRWDEMVAFRMDQMLINVKAVIDDLKKSGKISALIIEGILIFNHEKLNSIFSKRYFMTLTKEEAFKRRLTRTYEPADTANIFDDHVWPMFVKYSTELHDSGTEMTELDGTDSRDEILNRVRSDAVRLFSDKK